MKKIFLVVLAVSLVLGLTGYAMAAGPASDSQDLGSQDPYVLIQSDIPFRVEGRPLFIQEVRWSNISDRNGKPWGTYYSGDPLVYGYFILENRGYKPYALALWVSIDLPWPQGTLEVTNLRASQLGPGGFTPAVELTSPNDLIIKPGEVFQVEFTIVVAPYAESATVPGFQLQINHLEVCEIDGTLQICPGKG